jgi:hypothetical protein
MSYGAASEELRDKIARRLDAIVQHAEALMNDEAEERDRTYVLEDMVHRVDLVTDWLDRERGDLVDTEHRYAYPMQGERS